MLSLVLGTRPEIIKFSPVIRECERRDIPYFVLHTGQHYSYQMDRIFFEELELPEPEYNLDVGSGLHGEQTGKILAGAEKVLLQHRPDAVLVQGDTNTVLAGALAAAKLRIPVGHVEAGLRSFDRRMPEEINRIVADHIGDLMFAPTGTSAGYLRQEGIPEEKIFVTGNTVVDAVRENLEIGQRHRGILPGLEDLKRGHYILVTAHRAENVDERENLSGILKGLERLHHETGMPVVFPVHPRTEKMMRGFSLSAQGIRFMEPVGYLDFLRLESGARLILTDSGGVQEESCILGIPCVTLRENTERPETLDVGSNVLAGTDAGTIMERSRVMLGRVPGWENPYGDGQAGRRIVDILVEKGFTG
ncbi:MAG: UDP-N-acetylglucosamine 2-epimerase (non-hydrolyzing) [Methanolinea sp.]|jgi:UDP-N-acetylglucosamine 2-epimerase (non-hydrolysing)|nr:UDP-N-acetylglucosamine 2-epimerase (non-hydrolyzing) [Methanolinea sp.]